MKVTCPKCGFVGNISDKLIPDEGKNVTCPKCKYKFLVLKTEIAKKPDLIENLEEKDITEDMQNVPIVTKKQEDLYKKGSIPPTSTKPKTKGIYILSGCLAVLFLVIFAIACPNYLKFKGTTAKHEVEKKKPIKKKTPYEMVNNLSTKYPGYFQIQNINTDSKNRTEIQIDSYEESLKGRGCIGMAEIKDIEKTFGSSIAGIFGTNKPGTIIELYDQKKNMYIKLYLPEKDSDDYLNWNVGSRVLFAGKISSVSIGLWTTVYVNEVIIEKHW